MNSSAGPRFAPSSWLRLPRRTARRRFTLLYGGLFLGSGAVLLAITYLLFQQALNRQAVKAPASAPRADQPHGLHAIVAQASQNQVAQRAADLHQLLIDSGIALAIVALLALLLGWIIAGRMLRPVRTITSAARRISASNLHERLGLDQADEEFKQLGDTLDDLFARLEASFEAQRHFVANASHELRTPLTAERTLLQVALANPGTTAQRWRSTGEELLASSHEQERLIEGLLALASSEGGLERRERIDLSVICDDVLLRPDLDIDSLELHVETAIGSAPLEGDPRLIERLVANLVDNALRYNVDNGHVRIATGVVDGEAVLSVANTGPIIPIAEISRLFEPFQRLEFPRTHSVRDGHGLGLSIVRAIVGVHGATVVARPLSGGGLNVKVAFPASINIGVPSGGDQQIVLSPETTFVSSSPPKPSGSPSSAAESAPSTPPASTNSPSSLPFA